VRLASLTLTCVAIATLASLSAAQAATPFTGGARDDSSPSGASNGRGEIAAATEANGVRAARRADVVDPRILDGTEQRRLDRARDRWRRDGVRDYRFRVVLRCFCPSEITAPTVILVRRGRPQEPPSHLREAATVPRLLRIVQHAIDERVSGLSVHYGSRGVPLSIGIDSRRWIADDEREYAVERFWPASAPAHAAASASDGESPWLAAGLVAGLVLAPIGVGARTMRRRRRAAPSA
jgi:hypothetical protein